MFRLGRYSDGIQKKITEDLTQGSAKAAGAKWMLDKRGKRTWNRSQTPFYVHFVRGGGR